MHHTIQDPLSASTVSEDSSNMAAGRCLFAALFVAALATVTLCQFELGGYGSPFDAGFGGPGGYGGPSGSFNSYWNGYDNGYGGTTLYPRDGAGYDPGYGRGYGVYGAGYGYDGFF
ncbi:shematrin-like protein 2 [Amphibalanus amphitrite]|uniref:shematrin-like protein 2 n=1 Tax=Amphibalanus amphitrite TaxID=1232801 RepID=UPI001C91A401|nr:shematrin-like protein 2 [Amphibalanus amphitrite]XP_043208184.1 shematrin-like protein 2 [Amphibalanus amphitrite]